MPLGIHVPLAIKEKIWRGEYVDVGSLLEGSSAGGQGWDGAAGGRVGMFSISDAGQISYAPRQSSKIRTIEEWTDGFMIFAAIYGVRHPEKKQRATKIHERGP
jgi:hypothetical protein